MRAFSRPPAPVRPFAASRGVALVVTLMMMSVLVMMVVGLAGVMRNEQAAARNLTYQVLADQLAEIGGRAGMAAVQEISAGGSALPTATGPGWAYLNSERPLYSTGAVAAGRKNLEEIGTNSLILSLRDGSSRGTLQAAWVPVVPPGGNPNLPVGRFAWWVDDEGTKLNLNAGAGTNTNLLGMINPFPFSLSAALKNATLQPETAPWARGTNLVARSNAFPTLESLKDTNVVVTDTNVTNRRLIYRRNKGHLTVWSSNVDLNPWNQPKVSLSELMSPANIINDADFANLLGRTFANTNLLRLFGRDFVDKYGNGNRAVGSNVIRQTLANAYEGMRFLSNTTSPPLAGTNLLRLAGTNVPGSYQGQFPGSLYISEVILQPLIYKNPTEDSCQIQIWTYIEVVNIGPAPLSNNLICIAGATNTVSVRFALPTGNRTVSPGWRFFKTNGSANPPKPVGGSYQQVNPGGIFTNQFWFVFGGEFINNGDDEWGVPGSGSATQVDLVSFDLGDIVLLYNPGRRPYAVDWIPGPISIRNFNNLGNGPNLPQEPAGPAKRGYSYASTDNGAPANDAFNAALPLQSFSRTDPRARIFLSWTNAGFSSLAAWTNLPVGTHSWGQTNPLPAASAALPGGLVADVPAPPAFWSLTTNLINTNTNVPGWTLSATNLASAGFTSVSQLGQFHTSLPWRSLRLSSQQGTAGADADPPDWILLDLFTAAPNPTEASRAAPRLNPNLRIAHAGGSTNRLAMLPALLASLTNGDSWLAAADRWTATDFSTATNSLQQSNFPWVSGSTWPGRRAAAGLPNNAFFFTGEMLELEGIGNVGLTEAKREAAAAALADLVSPRSDTFSVWSVGQGLAVDTNRSPFRTNILGEVRRQTVFQRVPQFNPAGALTGYQLQVLYTRNHVVE